jgi:hypothetical protein
MIRKVIRTKKLMKAIEVLGGERMSDCSDEAFIVALQKGKIKTEQIYKTMQIMRYCWNPKRGYWQWRPFTMRSIQRLFAIVNKEDEPIIARLMKEI